MWNGKHTFSAALLIRSPFESHWALFPLRIDTLFGYTILNTAETGTGVVALLAGLLAVSASVLDLSPL